MRNLSILLAFVLSIPSFALEISSEAIETPVKTLERSDPSPAVACEVPTKKDPLCSDLAAFTCAPGEYDDGTGISQGGTARQDLINQQMTEARAHLKKQFEEAIGKPEKAYFRQIALSATGLTGSPECNGTETQSCNLKIADGLSQLSVQRLFPPQDMMPSLPPQMMGMGMPLKDVDYLLGSPDFQEIEKAEAQSIRTKLTDKTFENRLKDVIFPEVVRQILEVVSSRVSDEGLRKNLTLKISSIRFEGSDCSEATDMGNNGPSLNALLVPNAFYNPQSNTFKYCNGFIMTDRSEFKIASVIAHELGHSIDPCNIAGGPSSMAFQYKASSREDMEKENPFHDVIACLRNPESVNAQPLMQMSPYPAGGMTGGGTAGGMNEGGIAGGGLAGGMSEGGIAGGGMVTGGMGGGGPVAPVGGLSFGNPLCGADQIGESFSDWLSTEVVPRYMTARHPELTKDQFRYGYSNVFRGMCNNMAPKTFSMFPAPMDPHPPIALRVNKLFLAHPDVRRQMGCQNDPAPVPLYCGKKQ